MIKHITHAEASRTLGTRLPYGMNWYHVTCLQFYPTYGDWSQTWACEEGLAAIIGKRKQQVKQAELAGEVVRA